MLDDFRLQYPKGSLKSDFLGIEHGLFVVRTTVEVEGTSLGNGLAAAPTLEVAEDRARIRALQTVLSAKNRSDAPPQAAEAPESHPEPPPAAIAHPAPPTAKPVPSSNGTVPPRQTESIPEVARSPEPEPEPVPEIQRSSAPPPKATPIEAKIDLSPAAEAFHPPDASLSLEPELPFDADSPEPALLSPPLETEPKPTPPTPEKSAIASASVEAIDFSEVIARSNRELKRLGWTSEQGRNYLLQTYGKRSRQLLSDEELLEFVQFLEREPSPTRN